MYGKYLMIYVILVLSSVSLFAQGYNIGIRAGLGQNKFNGPTEMNAIENYKLSGGFHFGINFQWNFNDIIGVRSEIVYNQTGSAYEFSSEDGYFLYRRLVTGTLALDLAPRAEWPLLRDKKVINLTYSNSYLQFPITAHVRVNNKIDLFAGGYFGLMLNPLATGTINFGEGDLFEFPHIFEQGLEYDYNSDVAGEYNRFVNSRLLIVNGRDVDIPGAVGAYYFFEDDTEYEQKFKSVDYGLTGGFAYYLNRGFYTSLRVEYGMADITRTRGDVSLQELNPDKTFVFNDDDDRNLGFYISLGFKF